MPVPDRPRPRLLPADVIAERLLKLSEVAAVLTVAPRTVWRWVQRGHLPPPYAISPRRRRWKASEITQFIHELPPSPPTE